MSKLGKRFLFVVGILLTSLLALSCTSPGTQAGSAPKQSTPQTAAQTPTPVAVTLAAIHNPSSSSFNGDCLSCHADLMKRVTLSKDVKDAHVMMVPFTPGYDSAKGATNENCNFCHKGTDLRDHSSGNIRRDVNLDLCTACHGPSGTGKKLYTR